MPQKPKLTKKDQYILYLGVSLALMVQIAYEFAHEIILNEANFAWLTAQVIFVVVLAVLSFFILGKVKEE